MNIGMKVVGAAETTARMAKAAAIAGPGIEGVVKVYAQLLQTSVMAHASGRPGPNAPTGDYKRSITVEYEGSGAEYKATVGTNKPQGRRLEYGFVGRDSLGRNYNQPPYPHWLPAVTGIEPQFKTAIEAILRTL